ncbi:glycine cleavage system protein GcvH [Streptomyces rubradiris]|uniref:Glycine cleavage system H protein n=1 Tax=Streptomyces rubradiris TaxID=285531 RepID=A0ABQ3RDH1_STRRR|nr:glycine cleavage system protein GcvH [Streptomyces rubradiris]GHG95525.1 glycine cleavage system H protein [Streptomyces rubradiris]GHI53902.1 glycine cleavage system H protein [Streptomyces rubradiris]
MSNVPTELKYATSHAWVRDEGNGQYAVGLTDHAQQLLSGLVAVDDLPEVGANVSAGEVGAVVESVKAASDMYAPISGEIVAVNEALADFPELVNAEPYGDGWFFRVKASDANEFSRLLDADAYVAFIDE